METSKADLFTSVILVNNIHCPSCVSYAENVLRPLSEVVRATISIVNHEIRLEHHRTENAFAAIQELKDAAFEVKHVTTTDIEGKVISDLEIVGENNKRPVLHTWPIFRSRAQRKHMENCSACRTQVANQPKKAKIWSAIREKDMSFDVEKQESPNTPVYEATTKESSSQDAVHAGRPSEEESFEYVATLSIGGMTCASCSSSITKGLNDFDFVTSVNINHLASSGAVIYHGPKQNISRIIGCIEDIGYEASVEEIKPSSIGQYPESSSNKFSASMSIEGMTCGSCVGAITRGLEELSFVHRVNIDLVGNSGKIEFTGKENIDSILEKIDDLGYRAAVVELESQEEPEKIAGTASRRTITIAVDGMYCEHCPEKIMSALHNAFGNSIAVEQPLTLQHPQMRIAYMPSPPNLTVREIMKVISNEHEAFSTKIWHAPSIEERSRAMQHHEQRRILARLLFTFLVGIPTLIIGVIYMSLLPKTNSTKMWFEEPVWAGNVSRTEWALFIMTTPVMFFGADIFHARALKEIRAIWRPGSKVPILRRFYRFGSMNMLISAGTAVAYFSSVVILILDAEAPPQHNMASQSSTYFDTVTFLSFFILIGKFLEAYSKARTGDSVAMLSSLRPDNALLIESPSEGSTEDQLSEAEETQPIQIDMLEVGDKVKVLHGASPPTDGIVISAGSFLFDESSLTGESKPVKKVAGDQVFAGSVNVSQPVTLKVASIGGTSMLDKIVAVVRKGQTKRAPVERIADTITGYFVPVITLLAIITFVVWLGLGQSGALPQRYLQNAQGGWPFWSVEFAIAVFVVACPCGLGLAAPTALFVGGGLAAKHGVLVRGGGEAFQEASKLDMIVFDKTGTLTEGQMKVTDYEILSGKTEDDGKQALTFSLAKAMEELSTHPIAKAISDYCSDRDQKKVDVAEADITEIPGLGMRGRFTIRLEGQSDETVYEAAIGNQRLLSTIQNELEGTESPNIYLDTTLHKFQVLGQSTAILYLRCLSTNSEKTAPFQPFAVFAISDPIRPSTHSVLSALRDRHNLQVHMCTGDNRTTALAIASQVGIPPTHVRAGVMPMDKAAYIKELQQPLIKPNNNNSSSSRQAKKQRRNIVAFIGDGTNDTPALTAADVSIALASGSDIAISTSSFILLNTDLNTLLTLVALAKRVFQRVKWNFVWAAVYNVLLVPVAAGVFFRLGDLDGKGTGWKLGPVWASAAMALSSVSVVVSSLALRLPSLRAWWAGRKG